MAASTRSLSLIAGEPVTNNFSAISQNSLPRLWSQKHKTFSLISISCMVAGKSWRLTTLSHEEKTEIVDLIPFFLVGRKRKDSLLRGNC